MSLVLDHLWQSTAVLAVIGLLTLCFRNNAASVRHALWMAASLKFLLPFALLNELGGRLADLLVLTPPPSLMVMRLYDVSQPFSDGPIFDVLPPPGSYLLPMTVIWGAGTLVVAAIWLSRWWRLRTTLRAARPLDIDAPMPVRTTSTLLGPGLVGIAHPILLLPEGLVDKLSQVELQAVIDHEACHLRRRDNLSAALHMLVQAVFWFWPPVLWLGTRLNAERERACDEAVVAAGNDPQTYATSILKVCQHYVQSPLPCVAGVSGADLKQRVEDIMRNAVTAHLTIRKKALLLAAATALLMVPLMAGLLWSPMAVAQSAPPQPISQDATQSTMGSGLVIRAVDDEAGSAGADAVRMREGGEERTLWLRRAGQITGKVVTDVGVDTDARSGKAVVNFRFTPEAHRLFADMTSKNVGKRIAILVDGSVISAPVINEPILGGQAQASGDFNLDQARLLAARIMAGNTAR